MPLDEVTWRDLPAHRGVVRLVADQRSFRVDLVWPAPVVAVVGVTGEVDLDTAPRFKQALFRAADEGARQVIVDLSLVPFIDTTAIGAADRRRQTA